uniref:Replication protein A C-terminal domain-containing protein n=1 Tax=Timema shepardi TaxID=629360 RepID=A0A7R9BCB7_TIMSH|nr:unnamed protein product [Timema shepardi]
MTHYSVLPNVYQSKESFILTGNVDMSLVLCFQKNSISDCGVTHEDIMQQLPIKLTMTELKRGWRVTSGVRRNNKEGEVSERERLYYSGYEETVTFLSNEGHIYSTIDDEHFKSTDS